jgi:NAD(P)-dependent dehydrogenase (short-subunit alcohol dehydrogenase family)
MSVPDVTGRSIGELISLAGRGAVVTGGAVGIGYAIAQRLAEAGASVLLTDVADPEAPASRLATATGGTVVGAYLDVTDAAAIGSTAARAARELGSLDIWVNNAGIYPSTPVLELTDEDWDRVLAVNLRGSFVGAREAARQMVDAGRGGVIINIASTAGFKAAGPGVAHYVSSKHALVGLTKSLGVELGPHGIRVLGIAPTLIETPGIEAGGEAFRRAGLGDVIDSFAQRLPLGRVGAPDDVARVALFCASDLAMFMTGSTLLADGGDVAI